MKASIHLASDESIGFADGKRNCTICGEQVKRGAMWCGAETILLCGDCAVRDPMVLAALLADGVLDVSPRGSAVRPHALREAAEAALERFTTLYWRALAIGLLSEHRIRVEGGRTDD